MSYTHLLIERLQGVLKEEFVRLPYTEGIKILEEAVVKGHKFEFPVYWGVDLASEHERYLVEEHFKRPVILTDYPKEIKAFYMKPVSYTHLDVYKRQTMGCSVVQLGLVQSMFVPHGQ